MHHRFDHKNWINSTRERSQYMNRRPSRAKLLSIMICLSRLSINKSFFFILQDALFGWVSLDTVYNGLSIQKNLENELFKILTLIYDRSFSNFLINLSFNKARIDFVCTVFSFKNTKTITVENQICKLYIGIFMFVFALALKFNF